MARKPRKKKKSKRAKPPKTRSHVVITLVKLNHKAGPHKDKKKEASKRACRRSDEPV